MLIPSTNSKQYLPVIKSASGRYATGIDGRPYLDFTGSNNTVILGHKAMPVFRSPNYPGVSVEELSAIKLLKEMTGHKHFRFFMNGHNAVDCAIRLARHRLKKKGKNPTVWFKGYHGTSDAYMWTTKDNNGIEFQNSYQLTDLNSSVDILCYESRYENLLSNVKADIRICDTLKEGVVALYDKYNADIMLYGKSIANGYPLAVIAGDMPDLDEIYYSTTFGGYNGSFEAMRATIEEFGKVRHAWAELYNYAVQKLPPWESLDKESVKFFMDNGILNLGHWQIMTCHTERDIDKLAKTYKCLPRE